MGETVIFPAPVAKLGSMAPAGEPCSSPRRSQPRKKSFAEKQNETVRSMLFSSSIADSYCILDIPAVPYLEPLLPFASLREFEANDMSAKAHRRVSERKPLPMPPTSFFSRRLNAQQIFGYPENV